MKKDLHLCPKVKCPMNILVILRNIYSNPDLFDDEQYLCKRFSHYAFSDDQPTVIVVKVAELSASAPVNTAKKCPGNHAAPGETVFVRKIIHENVSNDIKDAPLIFAGGRGLMNEQSFDWQSSLTPQWVPPDPLLTAAGQGLQNKSARPVASFIPKYIWPSASPELSSIWPA